MKTIRRLSVILTAAILALAATALSACGDDEPTAAATLLVSTDTLVVIRAEKTGGSMEDAMKQFKAEGKLEYDGEDGIYGWYLTSVNGNTPTGNAYWGVYSTLGEYEGVKYSNAEYGTYDYDGTTCASASYGVSGMPMVAGNLYVLTVATFTA